MVTNGVIAASTARFLTKTLLFNVIGCIPKVIGKVIGNLIPPAQLSLPGRTGGAKGPEREGGRIANFAKYQAEWGKEPHSILHRAEVHRCQVLRMADWVMKQRNPDGGLPQVVDDDPAKKSISVVSGRSLGRVSRHPPNHEGRQVRPFAGQLSNSSGRRSRTDSGSPARTWTCGPKDFEADSVWHAVEYWLTKYDQTKDRECLRHAEADAWFAFLMWCPKQLSWVKNPTQTCHTEQENYLQYSNYCYNNRKYYCLDRLAKLTGQPLFSELCERVIQCGFWAQPTTGEWIGGMNERMSDPWMALSKDFNSTAQVYTGELATDAALQLLEMGFGKPSRHTKPD